jgi:hypothetical protein
MLGLSFQESREVVSQKLRDAVNRIKNDRVDHWFQRIKANLIPVVTYICIMILAVILLFISIANHSSDMFYGLIIVPCLVIIISVANLIFYTKTQEAKGCEVVLALQKIIDEFDNALKLPTKDVKAYHTINYWKKYSAQKMRYQ